MTRVFQRRIADCLPTAVGGKGAVIVDSEGRRYIDASGGAAVSSLGHSDPEVVAAIQDQAARLAYAHTSFFTTGPAEALADELIAHAPAGMASVYFLSGGSEAMETALKMARQYYVERGMPERQRFIARRQSYHGNTLGALAVGGNPARRELYAPLLIDVTHIGPCFAYRGQRADETAEDYGLRAANELEEAILALGPETVCGFVAETVVGATTGAVAATEGYFKRIRAICDRYDVLLILDEVMSGMGRTGTLHACEQEGIAPDLMCLAKGLGGGYQPIGACMVTDKVFEAFRDGSGVFRHGHTYIGHATACAAALAVQRAIRERDLLVNVRRQGEALDRALRRHLDNHPHVGDIRGRGLFRGIELVADRATKEPFPPERALHTRIRAEAMARGLICYPNGGTADGVRGDHVLLAPPFIVDEEVIADIASRLAQAIDAAINGSAAR